MQPAVRAVAFIFRSGISSQNRFAQGANDYPAQGAVRIIGIAILQPQFMVAEACEPCLIVPAVFASNVVVAVSPVKPCALVGVAQLATIIELGPAQHGTAAVGKAKAALACDAAYRTVFVIGIAVLPSLSNWPLSL